MNIQEIINVLERSNQTLSNVKEKIGDLEQITIIEQKILENTATINQLTNLINN